MATTESRANLQINPSSAISEQETPQEKDPVSVLGETVDYNGLLFTMTSVAEYEDTAQYKMDVPDEGNTFVLLNFTIENQTGESQHINMFYEESYCDDTAIDPEMMLMNVSGSTIWGDVANGKNIKGYVAYQVPKDWQTIEFYYNSNSLNANAEKVMFKAVASDVA